MCSILEIKKITTKCHPGIPPDQTRPSPISKVGWGITNEMEPNQVEDLREGSKYSHVYCINKKMICTITYTSGWWF